MHQNKYNFTIIAGILILLFISLLLTQQFKYLEATSVNITYITLGLIVSILGLIFDKNKGLPVTITILYVLIGLFELISVGVMGYVSLEDVAPAGIKLYKGGGVNINKVYDLSDFENSIKTGTSSLTKPELNHEYSIGDQKYNVNYRVFDYGLITTPVSNRSPDEIYFIDTKDDSIHRMSDGSSTLRVYKYGDLLIVQFFDNEIPNIGEIISKNERMVLFTRGGKMKKLADISREWFHRIEFEVSFWKDGEFYFKTHDSTRRDPILDANQPSLKPNEYYKIKIDPGLLKSDNIFIKINNTKSLPPSGLGTIKYETLSNDFFNKK